MSTSSSSAKKSPDLALSKRPLSKDFAQRVAAWFKLAARDLPWRETSDPYRIWISEVMLQQTTVATVIDYYQRFISQFPTLESLAAATEDEVLKLWQGLGYYRRAKNLRFGAQMIMSEFGGKFPHTREEILKVPGIGAYSAGSILSIAHRMPEAALDGNLIRVYSRLYGIREPVDRGPVLKRLWEIARIHVPSERAIIREFTEGMMELGAMVCTPANPRCGHCPVQNLCVAYKKGIQLEIPLKEKRMKRKKLREIVFLRNRGNKIAILKRGSDKKFLDFHRLPFMSLDSESGIPAYDLKYKYAVTDRDFEVFVSRSSDKLPGQFKVRWVGIKDCEELLFPTIDRRILADFGAFLR